MRANKYTNTHTHTHTHTYIYIKLIENTYIYIYRIQSYYCNPMLSRTLLRNSFVKSTHSKLFLMGSGGARRLQSNYASVIKLTKTEEFTKIMNSNQLSVFDFYATWCGPCKAMIPHISQAVEENPDIKFYKIDVDESPEIAKLCDVVAMPTFVFTKDGKILDKIVGANPHGLHTNIAVLKEKEMK